MADVLIPDWGTWDPGTRATLMFVVDEPRGQVLLIRKKRGLGAGKINGPGGKIDPGETALECAVRETQEELGVTALDPVKHGELWFQFVDGMRMHVAVFVACAHEGEAYETPEAIPIWTAMDSLPFDEMWADDREWLAKMLSERGLFCGKFVFEDDSMLHCDMVWDASGWMDGLSG